MNLDEMDFTQFQDFRRQWLKANPKGVDAADTRVYDWSERFTQNRPVFVEKSQYRCHLAEEYLNWLALDEIGKTNILISSGVRHSLGIMLKQTGSWIRPNDVYPEYGKIEMACGAQAMTYSARAGLPWEMLENSRGWNLLICDPLKPWGGQLDTQKYRRLLSTALRQNGMIWVDGAYAKRPHPAVIEAIVEDLPVIWLGSLSKGWLKPWILGAVLGHPNVLGQWRVAFQNEKKDTDKLAFAWDLLTNHPQRPEEVEEICRQARIKLLGELDARGVGMGVSDPGHGYMLRHELPASKLIEDGILALPGSIFIDQEDLWSSQGSILSAVGMGY